MTKKRSEIEEKYKWDLSLMYDSEESFESEKEELLKEILELEKYKCHITDSADNLYNFLTLSEKSDQRLENLYVYSFMKDDEELGNSVNINRKNTALEVVTLYMNMISFFNPSLLSLTKEEYNNLFNNKKLLEYKFMLDEIYKSKEHILSEQEEVIINELNSSMNNFDETPKYKFLSWSALSKFSTNLSMLSTPKNDRV